MNAFQTGLSALCHPAALASIALLLLNDHVFKQAFPSALTGKVSDFAGLLFFPLLLSALIGLLEKRSRRASLWGFGITAVVFTPLKLIPSFAGWVSALWGELAGGSVSITPDPTDLAALIMLLPAWRFWQHAPARHFDRRLGYAALALGALASVATQPCMPPVIITRLAQVEGVTYALGSSELIYQSADGGLTWQEAKAAPDAAVSELQSAAALPKIVCEDAQPQRCYRIGTQKLAVEFSPDGGQTWRTSWSIPAGRLTFMNRSRSRILMCERRVNAGPFDLIIPPQKGVIVAMGNEGVLVSSSGGWQRVKVGRTSGPTPFRSQDPLDAFSVVIPEAMVSFALAYLYWIGLTVWAAWQATRGQRSGGVFAPLWVLLFLVLFVVYSFLENFINIPFDPIWLIAGLGLCVVGLPALTWGLASRRTLHPGTFRRAGAVATGRSLLVLLALILPLMAWGFGFPPFYWMALAISLMLGGWVGWRGARSVSRRARTALRPV